MSLPQRRRRADRVCRVGGGIRIARVHQHADHRGHGHQLGQQLQPFRHRQDHQKAHAGEIPSRPVEAGDEAGLGRVIGGNEDNGNRGRGRLSSLDHNVATDRDDDGHPLVDQIGGQGRQSVGLVACRPVFDRDVPAFEIPGFVQTLVKSNELVAARFERHAA
jgi:hypothetical protein